MTKPPARPSPRPAPRMGPRPPGVSPPAQKQRGELIVDPATGERRLRLVDVRTPKGPEIELSLYDILKGTKAIEEADGSVGVRMRPVSLDCLASLVELQATGVGAPDSSKPGKVFRDTLKIALLIMNDQRPEGAPALTEKEMGRLITSANFAAVCRLIAEVTAPLQDGLDRVTGAGLVMPPDGPESSTGLLASSAGAPGRLAG